jgi:elongation factor G
VKDVAVADVRNFVLLGHTGSGKTTLCDALLFKLGLNDRLGSVSAGTSMADYTEEEIGRKISIYTKTFAGLFKSASGRKVQMMFMDTPGYDDFFGQVLGASRVADAALLTVDAVAGIQVGTSRSWKRGEALGLPRGIAVTGVDRDNADFPKILADIQAHWGAKCVPVVLPLEGKLVEVLGSDNAAIQAHKNSLIERAAESDDAMLEKFLGGEALTPDEIGKGLRLAVRNGNLIPVFAVKAQQDQGISELLEGIARLFPSPADIPLKDKEGAQLNPAPDAPFTGFVWRIVTDPFAGKLAYLRVYGGTLKEGLELMNVTQGQKERVGAFFIGGGKKLNAASEAHAGDIVALAKLKSTKLNDVICSAGHKAVFEPIVFPTPVVSFAAFAKEKGDEDKIGIALTRVAEDDPTLKVERHAYTNELVISGMGDTHLDVANELMKKRSNISVELRVPKVLYKETVTALGEGHYKHKKQSGGRGQYGEVYARMCPKKPDEEWFDDAVVGGVIPRNFIPACQKGFAEAMLHGALAGFPVVDVKVTVYDGSYHEVDSSEIAFKIAAARAFRDAMSKARPVLLEPIMEVKVIIPDTFMGDINGDLNHKRGRIMGVGVEDGMQVITAEVPQAEMFRYSSELRSITGGRGSFELKFLRYDIVPSNIAQKIIASAEKAKEDEE